MNKVIKNVTPSIDSELFKRPSLVFDSNFECGNLDMVFQVKEQEYDLYMRVDSNTRGHHQWFYFTVSNNLNPDSSKGKYRFNIVNFTKNASLYHQGMRINVFSQRDQEARNTKLNKGKQDAERAAVCNEGWTKGGENIVYKMSKISQPKIVQGVGYVYHSNKRYFQLSYDYEFQHDNDTVTFAYSVPYTFTKLQHEISDTMLAHKTAVPKQSKQFIKESILCKSLSGLEVSILTITSRVNQKNFEIIDEKEYDG